MDFASQNTAIDKNELIHATLKVLGLTQSYKGFHYLFYAVNRALDDPEILTCVCKGLYDEIAFYYQTSSACVERNIRTAKQVIWHNSDPDMLRNIFGIRYDSKIPCNSIFIDKLTYYIEVMLDQ